MEGILCFISISLGDATEQRTTQLKTFKNFFTLEAGEGSESYWCETYWLFLSLRFSGASSPGVPSGGECGCLVDQQDQEDQQRGGLHCPGAAEGWRLTGGLETALCSHGYQHPPPSSSLPPSPPHLSLPLLNTLACHRTTEFWSNHGRK